jgi:hypothetical protein
LDYKIFGGPWGFFFFVFFFFFFFFSSFGLIFLGLVPIFFALLKSKNKNKFFYMV